MLRVRHPAVLAVMMHWNKRFRSKPHNTPLQKCIPGKIRAEIVCFLLNFKKLQHERSNVTIDYIGNEGGCVSTQKGTLVHQCKQSWASLIQISPRTSLL